jgi:uncharacterized membrane protein
MSSPRLFVRAPEQVSVHPLVLTVSPSKANRVFAPRRRVLMQSRRTFALWLFLFCLISPLAVTQVYHVTDLGPLAPTAINNWGQVAGNLNGHAFIWTQWGSLNLGTLAGGTFSSALAINDFAEVAGTADGPYTVISPNPIVYGPNQECGDVPQPFVWTPTKGMRGLGTLGPVDLWAEEDWCVPYYGTGINAHGEVVGYTSGYSTYQWALRWTSAGGMTLFGGSWNPTMVNGVSNTGQIVGQNSGEPDPFIGHATWWKNGITTALVELGGGAGLGDYSSSANGVNDQGQIVGWSTTTPVCPVVEFCYFDLASFPIHAVLWTASGDIVDLGTLLGDTLSTALNINFLGQVIGSSGNTLGPQGAGETGGSGWGPAVPIAVIGRPFIWSQRSGMKDLNTLISAKSGWVLNSATGINFWGQIVGSGTRNGKPHGFLLTPKF